jgi:hypothetical protein
LRWVARGHQSHQPREVVRAARRRQRPHVFEPELTGELVDPPGLGGVRCVRQPHSSDPDHERGDHASLGTRVAALALAVPVVANSSRPS